MKLNSNELVWGACFGLYFFPWVGLWSLPLAVVSSILWALSGAGYPKFLRRMVVPWLACLVVCVIHKSFLIWISFPLAWATLSMGYGIPSNMPYDEGSALGRFWYDLLFQRGKEQFAELLTRGTIVLLLILSYSTLFWIK